LPSVTTSGTWRSMATARLWDPRSRARIVAHRRRPRCRRGVSVAMPCTPARRRYPVHPSGRASAPTAPTMAAAIVDLPAPGGPVMPMMVRPPFRSSLRASSVRRSIDGSMPRFCLLVHSSLSNRSDNSSAFPQPRALPCSCLQFCMAVSARVSLSVLASISNSWTTRRSPGSVTRWWPRWTR